VDPLVSQADLLEEFVVQKFSRYFDTFELTSIVTIYLVLKQFKSIKNGRPVAYPGIFRPYDHTPHTENT